MIKYIKIIIFFSLFIIKQNILFAESNFFEEGKKKFNEEKYEDSKFLFQRSLVFNPKDYTQRTPRTSVLPRAWTGQVVAIR